MHQAVVVGGCSRIPAGTSRAPAEISPRGCVENDGRKTMIHTLSGTCWSRDGWDSHVDFAQLGSDATAWIMPSSVGVMAHTIWNSMAQGITNPSL